MFRRLKPGETLRNSDQMKVGTTWIPVQASTSNPSSYVAAKKGPKYRRWVNKKEGYFSWLIKRIKNFRREQLCSSI